MVGLLLLERQRGGQSCVPGGSRTELPRFSGGDLCARGARAIEHLAHRTEAEDRWARQSLATLFFELGRGRGPSRGSSSATDGCARPHLGLQQLVQWRRGGAGL